AREIWGDRWDYSETVFEKHRIPVRIKCRLHGMFQQLVEYHLQKRVGCGQCSGQEVTQEEFIRRVEEVWGDRWDLSDTRYVNWSTHLSLRCPEHDLLFQQTSSSLLRGQ